MRSKRFSPIANGRKISEDIFFNKKRRKELKVSFLKTQKAILENSDFTIKPVLKEEFDRRILETSVLSFTVKGLEAVKNAEKYDKEVYYRNCKAYLFKKEKSVVLKGTFFKPLLNSDMMISYALFPQGLPENSRKKVIIYRQGNTFDLTGYKEIDSGTFRQNILNFKDLSLIIKGKKNVYKLKLTLVNQDRQSYWATRI
jgi:hypothetical protein